MTDKEVGELWHVATPHYTCNGKQMQSLIRKLVGERTSLLMSHYMRDTFRPTRFRHGKKESNPFYGWTAVEFGKMACEQFGIDPTTWKE